MPPEDRMHAGCQAHSNGPCRNGDRDDRRRSEARIAGNHDVHNDRARPEMSRRGGGGGGRRRVPAHRSQPAGGIRVRPHGPSGFSRWGKNLRNTRIPLCRMGSGKAHARSTGAFCPGCARSLCTGERRVGTSRRDERAAAGRPKGHGAQCSRRCMVQYGAQSARSTVQVSVVEFFRVGHLVASGSCVDASPCHVPHSGGGVGDQDMTRDEEHLRLLSIFHYVVAGLSGFFSLFAGIYILMGVLMLCGRCSLRWAQPFSCSG